MTGPAAQVCLVHGEDDKVAALRDGIEGLYPRTRVIDPGHLEKVTVG